MVYPLSHFYDMLPMFSQSLHVAINYCERPSMLKLPVLKGRAAPRTWDPVRDALQYASALEQVSHIHPQRQHWGPSTSRDLSLFGLSMWKCKDLHLTASKQVLVLKPNSWTYVETLQNDLGKYFSWWSAGVTVFHDCLLARQGEYRTQPLCD